MPVNKNLLDSKGERVPTSSSLEIFLRLQVKLVTQFLFEQAAAQWVLGLPQQPRLPGISYWEYPSHPAQQLSLGLQGCGLESIPSYLHSLKCGEKLPIKNCSQEVAKMG